MTLVRRGTGSAACGARRPAASATGRIRTESWLYRMVWAARRRFFGFTSQGSVRETRSCFQTAVQCANGRGRPRCTRSLILQEQSRLNIEVDNHEAVKIGDLEENSEAIKVVKLPVQQGDLLKTGRPGKGWTSWLLMRYWTHRLLQSHHRHQSTPQEAGLVCFEFSRNALRLCAFCTARDRDYRATGWQF